eukprot:m.320908 g.320908  ORF g.320908 m.320908 type:complete len:545 (+) comp20327_c0_seq2:232-1866(+)
MGKNGKHRKRVRLLRERELGSAIQVPQPSVPPSSKQKASSDGSNVAEIEVLDTLAVVGISQEDLATVVKTLGAIGDRKDLLRCREFKSLRSVLHPILGELYAMKKKKACDQQETSVQRGIKRPHQSSISDSLLSNDSVTQPVPSDDGTDEKRLRARRPPGTLSANSKRVTEALAVGAWEAALELLANMRDNGQVPKLGSVQRWVRVCDAAEHNSTALKVLDGILRTCDPEQCAPAASTPADASSPQPGTLIKHPPLAVTELLSKETTEDGADIDTPDAYRAHFKVISFEKGDERRPPNKYDLRIHYAPAAVIRYEATLARTPFRVDVPFVPKAFAMVGVLSPSECRQIIAAAEAVGYEPDEPITSGSAPVFGGGVAAATARAASMVWLASPAVQDPLLRRCEKLLPAELGGGTLAGINARWRLYRYGQNAVYRPHVDGAWPGSGLVDGHIEYDMYGDRWSRLTFLLYLNEGFEGGCTTFFTPGPIEGTLDARGILPRVGTVMCFPHGDTAGSLVHEGSAVTSGAKYIMRSDVLYRKPASNVEST